MTKDDMRKIKPCPFCGSNNLGLNIVTTTESCEEYVYKISCMKCFAVMENKFGIDMVECWNRRKES